MGASVGACAAAVSTRLLEARPTPPSLIWVLHPHPMLFSSDRTEATSKSHRTEPGVVWTLGEKVELGQAREES